MTITINIPQWKQIKPILTTILAGGVGYVLTNQSQIEQAIPTQWRPVLIAALMVLNAQYHNMAK